MPQLLLVVGDFHNNFTINSCQQKAQLRPTRGFSKLN